MDEPKTRLLRADELRAQLAGMADEQPTRIYKRPEPTAHPRPARRVERTATLIQTPGLSGQQQRPLPPLLVVPDPRQPRHPAQAAAKRRPHAQVRAPVASRPHRARKGLRVLGLALALLVLVCAATLAGQATPHANRPRPPLLRVGQDGSHGASLTAAQASTPGPGAAPKSLPATSGEAPGSSSPRALPGAQTHAPAAAFDEPSHGRGAAQATATTPRQAVDHLLAGRTRDALEAYRALSRTARGAQLAVVIELLQAELTRCGAASSGGASCAR